MRVLPFILDQITEILMVTVPIAKTMYVHLV